MHKSNDNDRLRRAVWPEVVFAPDLAAVLDLEVEQALFGILAGFFGPHLRVNGRAAVLRTELIKALTARSSSEEPQKELLP
jgi:hypothetical protein